MVLFWRHSPARPDSVWLQCYLPEGVSDDLLVLEYYGRAAANAATLIL